MVKMVFWSVAIFFLLSCKKEMYIIDNLYDNKIKVIEHGGMGIASIYPMNSYESIIKCLSLGADGVEFDVQMTKDSVLVLFHNQNLSQGTNLKGKISELLWSEVKNGRFIGTPYLNYAIISLDELFSNINNLHRYCYTLDCKPDQYEDIYIRALIQIIEKYELKESVYIESSSESFLRKLQEKRPEYKLFIYPTSFEGGLKTAVDLNLYGITISTAIVTKEQIQQAHNHGIRVAVWNVHSQSENRKAIEKNPDIIQTDNLVHLLKIL
jgi:glycerophosphoryl diester phosphodiesterase